MGRRVGERKRGKTFVLSSSRISVVSRIECYVPEFLSHKFSAAGMVLGALVHCKLPCA